MESTKMATTATKTNMKRNHSLNKKKIEIKRNEIRWEKTDSKRMSKRQIFHLMAGRDAETRGARSNIHSLAHTRAPSQYIYIQEWCYKLIKSALYHTNFILHRWLLLACCVRQISLQHLCTTEFMSRMHVCVVLPTPNILICITFTL